MTWDVLVIEVKAVLVLVVIVGTAWLCREVTRW